MKIIPKRKPIIVSEFNINKDDDMQPGLYDISIEDYHGSNGLSASGTTKILDCPYKYWYEYLNPNKPQDEKESRALVIGQAVHTLSLEPEKFEDKFAVNNLELPEIPKAPLLKDLVALYGKDEGRIKFDAGKLEFEMLKAEQDKIKADYAAKCEGKIMLSKDEFDKVTGMSTSIRSNKAFMKLIDDKHKYVEHSIYFNEPETGVLMKSRPDFFNHFMVLDLKTTVSAKQSDFEKSIFAYGYHRQAAMALDALTSLTGCQYDSFVILAVEKEAPYLTALYVLDQAAIELGRKQYKEAARIYKQCQADNEWAGYPQEVVQVTLPQWAFNVQ
jgi:PDDEXK-like domain of unknown function (DUF3799)